MNKKQALYIEHTDRVEIRGGAKGTGVLLWMYRTLPTQDSRQLALQQAKDWAKQSRNDGYSVNFG